MLANVRRLGISTLTRRARDVVNLKARRPLVTSGMSKRFSVVVAALVVGAISLSGCVSLGGQAPNTTPLPTRTDQGPLAPIGASAFDIGCDNVATAEGLTSVFGAEPAVSTEPTSGVGPAQILVTALEQDGALGCEWGKSYASPSMSLFALPAAADGFNGFRPALTASQHYLELDIFDGSFYNCYYGIVDQPLLDCEWHVLADDVWVTITLTGVLDTAFDARPTPAHSPSLVVSENSAVVEFLSAAVHAILRAPRLELTRSATKVGSCSELIDAAAIAETLPGEVKVHDVLAPGGSTLGIATAHEGDPMWAISMQRLGYRYCTVTPPVDGFNAAEVIVAPGGSWAFDQSQEQPIDGLGSAISECTNTDDGPYCVIAVVFGDTLVTVQAYEATPVVSLAIAKDVVAHLG
jgi:hypothetical protein